MSYADNPESENSEENESRAIFSDITPDFLEQNSGDGRKEESEKNPIAISREKLNDAEKQEGGSSSSRGAAPVGSSRSISRNDFLRQQEEAKNRGFTNNVRGLAANKKAGVKGRGSFAKKMGPVLTIISLFSGGLLVMSAGLMHLPVDLANQFKATFDFNKDSVSKRSNNLLKRQLAGRQVNAPGSKNALKYKNNKFGLSKRQLDKLSQQGIELDTLVVGEGKGAKKYKVLKYVDNDDNVSYIFPDEKAMKKAFKGKDKPANVDFFDSSYSTNDGFRHGYFQGAKTWRGSVAEWYDRTATKVLARFGITRNSWSDFKSGSDKITDPSGESKIMKWVKNKIKKKAKDPDFDGKMKKTELTEEKDDPDSPDKKKPAEMDKAEVDISKPSDGVDVDGKDIAKDVTDAKMGKYMKGADVLSAGSQFICGAMESLNTLSSIVKSNEMEQILSITAMVLEAVDKAVAHDSVRPNSDTPINYISNMLTKVATNSHSVFDGKLGTKKTDVTGPAIGANAITAIYSGKAANPKDPSIASFNFYSDIPVLGSILGFQSAHGKGSFASCTTANMTSTAISLAMDAAEWAGCAAASTLTFGLALAACLAVEGVESAVTSVAMEGIMGKVVSYLAPKVTNALTRDFTKILGGPDFGNALASGANVYHARNHQRGGGAFAGPKAFAAHLVVSEEILADRARFERETLSPFDMSSSNTFMGSLYSKIVPIYATIGQPVASISGITSLIGNSFSSLLPAASAKEITHTVNETAKNTEENCPNLHSVGAVGDAFCNPYVVSDLTTIEGDEYDPITIIADLTKNGQLEDVEADNPTIKEGSNLAKYVLYCGERESEIGIADDNIAADFDTGTTEIDKLDSIIASTPAVGDIMDIVSNAKRLANIDWITGESCVISDEAKEQIQFQEFATDGKYDSNSPKLVGAPTWQENKKYQRFIEDQRLAVATGVIEESAVTAFLDDHYRKHPLDNSTEGILARRTGKKKEDIIAALDFAGEMVFLAGYDPTNLAPIEPVYLEYEALELETNENNLYVGFDSMGIDLANIDTRREYLITA